MAEEFAEDWEEQDEEALGVETAGDVQKRVKQGEKGTNYAFPGDAKSFAQRGRRRGGGGASKKAKVDSSNSGSGGSSPDSGSD